MASDVPNLIDERLRLLDGRAFVACPLLGAGSIVNLAALVGVESHDFSREIRALLRGPVVFRQRRGVLLGELDVVATLVDQGLKRFVRAFGDESAIGSHAILRVLSAG